MAPGERQPAVTRRAWFVAPIAAVFLLCAVPLARALDKEVPYVNREHVPVMLVVAVIVLGLATGFHHITRSIGGAFGPTIMHLATATSAAVFTWNARRSLGYALAYPASLGLDYLEIEVIAPWAAFVALLGGSVAWAALQALGTAQIARGLRIAALVVVGAGAIAVAFGAERAARLPRAEGYVTSLPVVGTLRAIDGIDPDYRRGVWPAEDVELDGIFTRRRCVPGDGCSIQIVRSAAELSETRAVGHEWFLSNVMTRIVIRRDAAHGLLVIETGSRDRIWLDARTTEWANPSLDASAIGPPWRWVLSGLVGLVIAAIALAHRPVAVRRQALLARARDGQYDGARVTFEDGTPPFELPRTQPRTPHGPVLVVPEERPAEPSFRDAGAIRAAQVFAGTRDEHRETADAALATRASFAIAAVALACATLIAG